MNGYQRFTSKDGICKDELKGLSLMQYAEKLEKRLSELEDKIENGTLIELPCKVGDTVYEVFPKWQTDSCLCKGCENLYESYYEPDGCFAAIDFYDKKRCDDYYMIKECKRNLEYILVNYLNFGKTIFATREQAEQKVRELKE